MNPERFATAVMRKRQDIALASSHGVRRSPGARQIVLGCVLVLASAAGAASAEGYPDKGRPIKMIVGTGAASAVDMLARALGKSMSDEAGLNVIVENKPGAELSIGVRALMSSPPDGYTLMVTSSSSQTLNPVIIPNLKYDPLKDYTPVATLAKTALVMNLGASTGSMSAREFIEAARKSPGKYTCATGSTTQRMACEMLNTTAGIKLLTVPYKATASAMTALASGEVDVIFVDAGSAKAQWQSGRVRGAAVTSERRLSALPALPTLREEGVANFNMAAWYAVYIPNQTPPAVVATIREIVRKSAKSPQFAEAMSNYAMERLDLTQEQINDMTRSEIQTWTKAVNEKVRVAN
ncbi:Tripartite tricarboxylate transporter family receptor [compost metagenome]